jgi:hypothetical protein
MSSFASWPPVSTEPLMCTDVAFSADAFISATMVAVAGTNGLGEAGAVAVPFAPPAVAGGWAEPQAASSGPARTALAAAASATRRMLPATTAILALIYG